MKRHERDLSDWPVVTVDDVKALLWLIAFAVIFVAITAVGIEP